MLKGGCYCGKIRYEATGLPFHETICHCSICRRTSGAPFVAWFSVRTAEFRFVFGSPKQFRSTPEGMRSFCGDCGTPITFQRVDCMDEIDITTCSLDDPEAAAPRDHTRASSRVKWVRIGD